MKTAIQLSTAVTLACSLCICSFVYIVVNTESTFEHPSRGELPRVERITKRFTNCESCHVIWSLP